MEGCGGLEREGMERRMRDVVGYGDGVGERDTVERNVVGRDRR